MGKSITQILPMNKVNIKAKSSKASNTDKESFSSRMAMYTQGSITKIIEMDTVSFFTRMEKSIKAISSETICTEKESITWKTAQYVSLSTSSAWPMDQECKYLPMVISHLECTLMELLQVI